MIHPWVKNNYIIGKLPSSGVDCLNEVPKLSEEILMQMVQLSGSEFEYDKLVDNIMNNKHNMQTTY